MKRKYINVAAGGVLLLGLQHAQVFVDGTTFNNFGYVSNYDTHTEVTSSWLGVYRGIWLEIRPFRVGYQCIKGKWPLRCQRHRRQYRQFQRPAGLSGHPADKRHRSPQLFNAGAQKWPYQPI